MVQLKNENNNLRHLSWLQRSSKGCPDEKDGDSYSWTWEKMLVGNGW